MVDQFARLAAGQPGRFAAEDLAGGGVGGGVLAVPEQRRREAPQGGLLLSGAVGAAGNQRRRERPLRQARAALQLQPAGGVVDRDDLPGPLPVGGVDTFAPGPASSPAAGSELVDEGPLLLARRRLVGGVIAIASASSLSSSGSASTRSKNAHQTGRASRRWYSSSWAISASRRVARSAPRFSAHAERQRLLAALARLGLEPLRRRRRSARAAPAASRAASESRGSRRGCRRRSPRGSPSSPSSSQRSNMTIESPPSVTAVSRSSM